MEQRFLTTDEAADLPGIKKQTYSNGSVKASFIHTE